MIWLLSLAMSAAGAACRAAQPRWNENDGGRTRWIDVAGGPLKTRVYAATSLSTSPVLVLVVHGDLPEPPPSYQYEFAKLLASTGNAADIVAAGVLRPGYSDPTGDRSSGDMGRAIADNYTEEVVDAVAFAAHELSKEHHASPIIIVGHSGGAAVVADLLGRHPGLARGAVLVGCGCDPAAWRKRRRSETGNPMFDEPTRSLQPLNLASAVAPDTIVRMVVGQNDDVVSPDDSQAYAAALRQRGIDVSVDVIPGLGHNILFEPRVIDAVTDVLNALRSTIQ